LSFFLINGTRYGYQRTSHSYTYVYTRQLRSFKLLHDALHHGHAVWLAILNASPSDLIHLLNLTFIIEDHVQTLVDLVTNPIYSASVNHIKLIKRLQTFYSSPEINDKTSKKISLQSAIKKKSHNSVHWTYNYYHTLIKDCTDYTDMITTTIVHKPYNMTPPSSPKKIPTKCFFRRHFNSWRIIHDTRSYIRKYF